MIGGLLKNGEHIVTPACTEQEFEFDESLPVFEGLSDVVQPVKSLDVLVAWEPEIWWYRRHFFGQLDDGLLF